MAARLQVPTACSLSSLLPFLSRHSSSPIPKTSLHFRRFSSGKILLSGRRPMDFSAEARRGSSHLLQQEDFASPADLQFESPLKIVEYPDPLLRARNKRINTFDENLKKLAQEMFDIMYKTDGIGLSAPQVGVNVQLMVFNPAGEPGKGEEIVLVNPVVFKSSVRKTVFNEGCLSFPGIYADVERPATIKVDARDVNGAKFKVNLSGLSARVFQHEFDHLQGVLFFDRMTYDVLDTIRSELKELEKKYESRTGLPSPESIDNYIGKMEAVGFTR